MAKSGEVGCGGWGHPGGEGEGDMECATKDGPKGDKIWSVKRRLNKMLKNNSNIIEKSIHRLNLISISEM